MSVALRLLSGNAFAHEKLTVVNAVKKFTVATFSSGADGQGHLRAVVSAEGGQMRFRYDGGNPSTTSGHILSHKDDLIVEGSTNVTNFKAIRTGAESGFLSVTYERVY